MGNWGIFAKFNFRLGLFVLVNSRETNNNWKVFYKNPQRIPHLKHFILIINQ